jgi:hypothetical protein
MPVDARHVVGPSTRKTLWTFQPGLVFDNSRKTVIGNYGDQPIALADASQRYAWWIRDD